MRLLSSPSLSGSPGLPAGLLACVISLDRCRGSMEAVDDAHHVVLGRAGAAEPAAILQPSVSGAAAAPRQVTRPPLPHFSKTGHRLPLARFRHISAEMWHWYRMKFPRSVEW